MLLAPLWHSSGIFSMQLGIIVLTLPPFFLFFIFFLFVFGLVVDIRIILLW